MKRQKHFRNVLNTQAINWKEFMFNFKQQFVNNFEIYEKYVIFDNALFFSIF